jgi:hypothetical protein
MSPPVLGTLLGLAMTMILPNRKMSAGIPRSPDQKEPKVDFAEGFSSENGITLDHQGHGLFSLFLNQMPSFVPNPIACSTCAVKFAKDEPVFAWRACNETVLVLHHTCMMEKCDQMNFQCKTLDHVRAMLQKTGNNKILLQCLFDCEDFLAAETTPWEVVDTDEGSSADSSSVDDGHARPLKSRRFLD